MNSELANAILADCRSVQLGGPDVVSTGPDSRTKRAAKARAAELVAQVARQGDVAIEIGAEANYRSRFESVGVRVVPLNLPDDMHDLTSSAEFDGAIAMHVLEHSPFPLYVLRALHRAVVENGWLYVAVPHPTPKWVRAAQHFSVLHPDAWARLLGASGWRVVVRESGKLAPRDDAVEERFLCRRAA